MERTMAATAAGRRAVVTASSIMPRHGVSFDSRKYHAYLKHCVVTPQPPHCATLRAGCAYVLCNTLSSTHSLVYAKVKELFTLYFRGGKVNK